MEKKEFLIPLNGLTAGKTVFRWTAGKEFFDGFGNSDIIRANVGVEAVVEKSGQYIGIDCTLEGEMTVECDRCLGELSLPVDSVALLSVKFGDSASDESGLEEDRREVVYVSSGDTDFDISQIVYDYACLALPMQRVHEEGECDPEVISRLGMQKVAASDDNEGTENPFSALKDIFKS